MACPFAAAENHQLFRESAEISDRAEDSAARNFCKPSLSIDCGHDFRTTSQVQSYDGFMIGRFMAYPGKRDPNKASLDQCARERFTLYVPLQGELELRQFSRTERCCPGSIILLSPEKASVTGIPGDNDTLYFHMSRAFVDQRVTHSECFCARSFAAQDGVRRLVRSMAISLQRDAPDMTEQEFRGAARALGELTLLALCGAADLSTDMRSVRARNLARAKRVIRNKMTDSDFGIGDVARDCGISLRYLHALFRSDGITVSGYLKRQRLQRARDMLENAGDAVTVTEVCFSCGFSNMSQFSTAFRQAFSVSPRDVLRRTP